MSAVSPRAREQRALHAQLAEIDENLFRANLTPTQEAEHLAKRKEIWDAMKSAQVEPKSKTVSNPKGAGHSTEFAADAAVSILLAARRTWHTRRAAEKALGCLSLGEKSLLLLYAFEERSDAERVLQFSDLCGVRAPVARFSLAKLMYPALFNAGAFSEDRPKGRRAVIDAEVRRADQLLDGWLRMGSAAFLLAYALDPPTSGETQNPT